MRGTQREPAPASIPMQPLDGEATPSKDPHPANMPLLRVLVLSLALPLLLTAQASATTRPGRRPLLAAEREVALARSAAPREVSAHATIYLLTDTGFVVSVEGDNGNACLVDRSWPTSIEPICYDPEARASHMQMTLAQMAAIQRGVSPVVIDRMLADGLRSGRFRLPTRPAMSYMMSGGQQLIGDDGRPAGRWQPHLMLFIPYITSEQLGLGAVPNVAAAIVVDSGKPTAQVMVIVKQFVEPVFGDGQR